MSSASSDASAPPLNRISIVESKDDDASSGATQNVDASADSAASLSFTFASPATPFEYPSLTGDNAARWSKWGLLGAGGGRLVRLSVVRGGREPSAAPDAFLRDLFASASLRAELPVLSRAEAGGAVTFRALRTGAATLDLLEPLFDAGALRRGADGTAFIQGRLEESYSGLSIVNDAREALCLPADGDPLGEDPGGDADALVQPNRYGCVFSTEQRAEALFCLARWVVAGGGMCQYEDVWAPYAAAIKDVARDVLSVVRGGSGVGDGDGAGAIRVVSAAWQVTAVAGVDLWPDQNPHNACLVFADPVRRVVHVLYSPFIPWC